MNTATTRAIVTLCARPGGMRNDPPTRDLLGELLGRQFASTDVSPQLRKFERRQLIRSAPTGKSRMRVYTITPIGRDYLAGKGHAKPPGRPRHAVQTRAVDWRKAPLIGDPRKPAPAAPKAVLRPVEAAMFQPGEFTRLGPGRYLDEGAA